MAYEKQNFVSGQILQAEHLNKMEQGIADNDFGFFGLQLSSGKVQTGGLTFADIIAINDKYALNKIRCTLAITDLDMSTFVLKTESCTSITVCCGTDMNTNSTESYTFVFVRGDGSVVRIKATPDDKFTVLS